MNILFDLDGTLTDPFVGITGCISHALEKLGRPSPPRKRLQWCIGPPLRKSFATLLGSDDQALVEKALSNYRERFSTVGLFENKVYAGIPEALASLRANGHELFVATSKPLVYASRIVDHFGMRPYFSHVYGSELDGTRNDKTVLISHILAKESISSANAVMIGDRAFDMIGAGANGVRGIGALWGYGSPQELTASGAHVCVGHPRELTGVIN